MNRTSLESLQEIYRNIVEISYRIAEHIADQSRALADDDVFEDTPYPRCSIRTHNVAGKVVYQLFYDGALPLYFDKDPKLKSKAADIGRYQSQIRDSYVRATADAVRSLGTKPEPFERSFLYICHFFGNLVIRDLDNRNRSCIINAVRYAGLIRGDEWERLEIMESGFLDPEGKFYVVVFVAPMEIGWEVVNCVKQMYRNGYRFRI